jgi:alpha-1,3/alpha-1,6-mannosyltransferase
MFYCHFPDKTLEQTLRKGPSSRMRLAYRSVVDALEAYALRHASAVVCNSEFTKRVFCENFPSLPPPQIVYPCVQVDRANVDVGRASQVHARHTQSLVSLNRFERKKNIPLAVHAFKAALDTARADAVTDARLVVAGGYDARLKENVEHFAEIEELVIRYGLQDRVVLRRNISDDERRDLISSATALIYTPQNEHFGIVPLEAMALGTPVLAADSGGPTESIVDGLTGYLRAPNANAFSEALVELLQNPEGSRRMGAAGRTRVEEKFSIQAMAEALIPILESARRKHSAS